MGFEDIDISDETAAKLRDHEITEPTEVQERSIPAVREGKDVLVESETGSGKTFAFVLPLVEQIEGGKVRALILTPVRELAKQVSREIEKVANEDTDVVTIYGGVSYGPQIEGAKTANIVVGTPGRVLDLLKQGKIDLDGLEYFVLDEADRMLDMGFQDELEAIIDFCPTARQNLLFGATIPRGLRDLCDQYHIDPEIIRIDKTKHTRNLQQKYIDVKPHKKLSTLYTFLKERDRDLSIVFCQTKDTTRWVADKLRKNGIDAQELNGDMSQHQREELVKRFKQKEVKVIVATDVAARGLHIDDVSHIFNYDVPDTPDTYTHRIGRAGRQGEEGEAITLLEKDDHGKFRKLHRENRELERIDKDSVDVEEIVT